MISSISFLTLANITGEIRLAKAAELAAHRIDRLVTLSKIDAGFLNRLEKIEVNKIENADPIFYRALVSQTSPSASELILKTTNFRYIGQHTKLKQFKETELESRFAEVREG